MSEKIPLNEHHELMKVPEEALLEQENLQKIEKNTPDYEKAERQRRNIEYLKEQAEIHASSREKTAAPEEEKPAPSRPVGYHQKEKAETYQKTLEDLQANHNSIDRKFSRFIHKPVVEKASELAGRTIARPSAILGGGIAGLLGSSIMLFSAKRYGFEYNFFVFIGLFMLGYFIGVIAEFLLRALRHPHTR